MNPAPVRILLVDDDPLVRAGLRMIIGSAPDLEVVAEAGDGSEVLPLIAQHRPDVLLMDIRMPTMDGIAATQALTRRPNAPQIVMLTTFNTDQHVLRALQAGAAGFLLKDTPPATLIDSVRKAAAGEPVLSPAVTLQLIGQVKTGSGHNHPAEAAGSRLAALGERELEVARAIGQGKTNAEIAAALYLSIPTVKTHVSNILTKLDLTNRVQIALMVHHIERR
ncbi:response regulator transcription factor [Streptomyces sp. NBC_01304]|uniref:response regulator transcription factor n=1 Tax=Streptomyces sp. NBC_01304 TaxID=2903818 RepID=UPI002E15DBCD|nr:response regulator transcription factor [Streptomyces sp. NBC_01304]